MLEPQQPPAPKPFRYVHSSAFPALLEQLGITLAVTTYQAGKLMLVRSAGGKLSTLLRSFDQPMGLAVDDTLDRMVVGTKRMVWMLRSVPDIAPQLDPPGRHDHCFIPRAAHVTGDFRSHEIALIDGKPWIVNTRFSCVCTLDDDDYGFVPRWRPPFIDQLAAEDRCHLNGMAVRDGRIRYLTALGESNQPQGWRENKVRGGIVIDFGSGETIARGLAMPHSPRCYRDGVFILNSGHGNLSTLDPATGRYESIAEMPGYTRGLAFCDRYAFVGLSKIRESNIFGGLPIADRYDDKQRKCGVYVVDLVTGKVAAFLCFESGCDEIFDIQVLAGVRWPSVVGFQKETLDGIFIAPPANWKKNAAL
jgi:uncharacterized protein (TIGR03032 family)